MRGIPRAPNRPERRPSEFHRAPTDGLPFHSGVRVLARGANEHGALAMAVPRTTPARAYETVFTPRRRGRSTASPGGASTTAPCRNAERMHEVLSTYNDEPILYYGRLEDQLDNPVSRAIVRFSVAYNTGIDSRFKNGQTTTDSNGLFTVSGFTGESLSVNPQKQGYALASTNGHATYSRLF
jgi:hypothetical protein